MNAEITMVEGRWRIKLSMPNEEQPAPKPEVPELDVSGLEGHRVYAKVFRHKTEGKWLLEFSGTEESVRDIFLLLREEGQCFLFHSAEDKPGKDQLRVLAVLEAIP